MKIYGKDIEYVKIKDSSLKTSSSGTESFSLIEIRVMLFLGFFILSSIMFTTESPYVSFFYNFSDWTFFEFGILKPQHSIAILLSMSLANLIDYSLMKFIRWLDK